MTQFPNGGDALSTGISTPYINRGNFVYIQSFNSPVVYNTYETMSYVAFSSVGKGIAKQMFPLPLPHANLD